MAPSVVAHIQSLKKLMKNMDSLNLEDPKSCAM
jgi:hypothetical protein